MNKTKILIVENESIVALELKIELEKLNCEVTATVHTKKDVFSSIKHTIPDIIMMDINLGKDENGIEIVKEIQKKQKIPILYLTAYSDDNTMNEAFSTNPIGYIIKPFKIEELKTNILLSMYKLNKKDVSPINKEYVSLGDEFYFDMKSRKLYYRDKFIKLGKKEQHLLFLLINANYSHVPIANLEEAIWNGNQTSISALRTLVYRLKGKIGNIIEVTYGYGYSLKELS